MNKLAKTSLFGIVTLAIAALMAHVIGCANVGDHAARTVRLDLRSAVTIVTMVSQDHGGASGGRDKGTDHRLKDQAAAALLPRPVLGVSVVASSAPRFAAGPATTRNTSLAHRRVTVLLI